MATPSEEPPTAVEPETTTDTVPPTPPVPVPAAVPVVPAVGATESFDPTLLISILLPLLIAVYFLFGRKSSGGRGRRLLLFGPVGGGKTALYHRLKHGRVVPTVSSMEPASASFVLRSGNGSDAPSGSAVYVCDMPGSGRLRERLKAEASDAAALVCVLDGTQLAAQAKEAAGMLFDVFTVEGIARRPPPLLIAVNKSDIAGCVTPAAARKAVEVEVQRVRLARTTMADTSGREKQHRGIADDSAGAFTFEQLDTVFELASISAYKPKLDGLLSFAQKHAR